MRTVDNVSTHKNDNDSFSTLKMVTEVLNGGHQGAMKKDLEDFMKMNAPDPISTTEKAYGVKDTRSFQLKKRKRFLCTIHLV